MITNYDELFCHQAVSTFDRPGTSAREGTERAWLQIHHVDGGLHLATGFGYYGRPSTEGPSHRILHWTHSLRDSLASPAKRGTGESIRQYGTDRMVWGTKHLVKAVAKKVDPAGPSAQAPPAETKLNLTAVVQEGRDRAEPAAVPTSTWPRTSTSRARCRSASRRSPPVISVTTSRASSRR